MAQRGFYHALFSFSVLAGAILIAPLPAGAEKSAAQQHRDVEVNLDVLDNVRSYRSPQTLPPPSQPSAPNSTDTPFLTAPDTNPQPAAAEPRPEALLEHPETAPLPDIAISPQPEPPALSWSEPVPKPARKPYVGRAIEQPDPDPESDMKITVKAEAEAKTETETDSTPVPDSAPVPDLPPEQKALAQTPVEEALTTPPLPPRRPAKINAPESFVREARQNYEIEQLKPVKPLPVEEAPLEIPLAPMEILPEESTTDPLETALVEQTPRDVLASIDPAAHLPPAPSVSPPAQNATEPVLLGYKPGVTALPEKIQTLLHERLLLPLQKSEDTDLQITAYASVVEDRQNSDRRIALERALAVRDFFTAKGIPQERLHIRALGKETDIEPLDRVEIVLSPPAPL